jgi:hypothetical protein
MYILMKVFFKTNHLYDFHIFKLNDLKVIHDLYSQCLTQTLSKTTSNREPEGVGGYWGLATSTRSPACYMASM